MIELLEEELRSFSRQSSKGNQLKGCKDGKWYKADYAGYEGFAEYVISALLKFSFTKKDVEKILKAADKYGSEVIDRVRDVIYEQMRRYLYLF